MGTTLTYDQGSYHFNVALAAPVKEVDRSLQSEYLEQSFFMGLAFALPPSLCFWAAVTMHWWLPLVR